MRQKTSIRLLLLFLVVIVLTACGSGARRADFTEQACETQGSVYWIKLESFDAVARKDAALADENSARRMQEAVMRGLGRPFRPNEIVFVSSLPMTRNQKIMRRLVRAVFTQSPPGDTSSLVNPEAVEELKTILADRVEKESNR